MSDPSIIERYAKDPSRLVELCTEVISALDPNAEDADISDQETQIREISRTIERLEKASVAVPEVLRSEKVRLVAAIAVRTDATQALSQLADELENIVTDLRERLGHDTSPNEPKPKKKRSQAPKTDTKG